MKQFKETIIAKPGFVKTKAYGLCGTIALFAGLALVMGTAQCSADEVQPTSTEPVATVVTPTTSTAVAPTATSEAVAPTATSEATATVAPTATSEAVAPTATSEATPVASTATSTATSEATPVASTATSEATTPAATSKATEDTTPSYPEVKPETKITKDGTNIKVENPDVHMEFPNGHGIYAVSSVHYHVDFPDDIVINDNDTVTVTLPKELTFPTQYKFDVTNPDGVVIGKAIADSAKNTIVTTFNDYFKKNPLHKSMNLELSVRWTAYIEPDKEYTISIDGTAIKYHSSKEIADVDPTRALSKWGSQDKTDPTLINWVLQLNYGYLWSKQVLTDYQLLDTLGPNQKLVEDSFSAEIVDSVVPFKTSGDAMHYLQDLKTSPESFSFKIAKLDRLIYVHYKTKLTQAEKDSYNPTNHVDLTYKSPDEKKQNYDSRVALVNGRGDARGDYLTTPAQVTFKLSKELTGRTLQNGEFTFQLKAADGTVLDTKTNDADGHITFDPITYRQAGTYKYTVEEVKGTDEDIHYDDMKATILVAVDKEGRAYVAHTTMPEDTIFNNSVKQTTPAETVLTFDKVLAKGTLKDHEFQFQLRDDKGNIVDTATNDASGKITFKPLVHAQAGVYRYTVKEVNTNDENIVYDNKVADVTIKVAKTIGETLNSMVSTVTYPQDKTFTNTVKDLQPATASLHFTKRFEGGQLKGGEFTFELRDDKGTVIQTVTNDKDGNVTFNPITYTEAGNHIYHVSEVKGTDPDVIYDSKVADVNVMVVKTIGDTLNTLVSTTKYPQETAFINKVKETKATTAEIVFNKALHGRDLKAGEFTFNLRDEKGQVIATASNDDKGKIAFTGLTYDKVGTHHYVVTEVKGSDTDVIYDDMVADVTVNVTKQIGDKLNTLVSSVVYPKDTTFDNTIKETKATTAEIVFNKALHGRDLKAGEFTFTLRDEKGQVIATASNDDKGKIAFTGLTYDKAGTHHYVVTEVKGSDTDIIYDDMVADVTVNVTKQIGDKLNTLVSSVVYPNDTTFDNTVKETKQVESDLVFHKVLHGRDLKAGEFTFNLYNEHGDIVAKVRNTKDGLVTFKGLTFDKPGDYHYTVTEVKGSDTDVIYDSMVADVTVKVSKEIGDKLNVLKSVVTYPTDITFDNTIKELKPVTASLSFDKLLKGRDLKENEFTFALFEVTDKGEQFKGFAQNDKNGHITFGNLTFDTQGQHHFEVKEVVGNDEDVIYDSTVAKADIIVTKTIHDTFNALVSNVEYSTKTFTNTIKELKGTEVALTFHKELHGRDLKDGEFMFALFEETDNGNVFYGFATNDAKGNIVFDHLAFDKPGVHHFFVQEVIGKDSSVTYDDLIARATVTIEKVIGKTENSLKATVKYSDDITFDNSVKPEKPKGETPKPKGDKPKGETPKGDTPKGETPKQEQYQKGNTLPNTGDTKGNTLGLIGIVLSLVAVGLFGKTRKHN